MHCHYPCQLPQNHLDITLTQKKPQKGAGASFFLVTTLGNESEGKISPIGPRINTELKDVGIKVFYQGNGTEDAI